MDDSRVPLLSQGFHWIHEWTADPPEREIRNRSLATLIVRR